MQQPRHPILSCEQSMRFERALLQTEAAEWAAMRRAGAALGAAILADWQEAGGTQWRWNGLYAGADAGEVGCSGISPAGGGCVPAHLPAGVPSAVGPRLLVLVGKGHNGGDALLAALEIASRFDLVQVVLYRTHALEALRPLCRRAWDALLELAQERPGVLLRDASEAPPQDLFGKGQPPYVFCIDGLLGMQSRPPLRGREAEILAAVNSAGSSIGLRAAVDLPSGLGDAGAFRADFTYATGIAKETAFKSAYSFFVGRLRYLDIGFFAAEGSAAALAAATGAGAPAAGMQMSELDRANDAATGAGAPVADASPQACDTGATLPRVQVLTPAVLDPFRGLRSPFGDKRHYGHLFILGGSAQMPGALLMNVQSALRSGAGLVTAFAPESVAHIFAAQAPEAMWVPWPETEDGTLALEGQYLLATRLKSATALLMGSGMGRSAETLALLEDIARTTDVPLVLDADALQPSVLAAAARHPRHGVAVANTTNAANAASTTNIAGAAGSAAFAGNSCADRAGGGAAGGEFRPVVITPHAGEFLRLCPQAPVPHRLPQSAADFGAVPTGDLQNLESGSAGHACSGQSVAVREALPASCDVDMNDIGWADSLRAFCTAHGVVTVLKGVQTRVSSTSDVAYGLFGGPVLARGGSGDVLAGLVGGCLVQRPREPFYAAQQAVCWHGLAAQSLARERGAVSVTTLDLISHLPSVIRNG